MCYTMTLASYKGTLTAICKLNSINIIFKSYKNYLIIFFLSYLRIIYIFPNPNTNL